MGTTFYVAEEKMMDLPDGGSKMCLVPLVCQDNSAAHLDPKGYEMDLTTSNTKYMFDVLGLELTEDRCGEFFGEDLIYLAAKCEDLLKTLDSMPILDAKKDAINGVHPLLGMRCVDLGRRDGYLSDKLKNLLLLIRNAIKSECCITYC